MRRTLPARAIILPTHTPALLDQAAARAAELLRAGQVVALPTETVYGLAANALDPAAVQAIFKAKGRPAHNPIIVHVASVAMAQACVRDWQEPATTLARAFWPGPLTLVLPRATIIPDAVTACGETVGVRWPAHPLMQAVIRRCGFPLAAPSANLSTRISPTTAEHVRKDLGNRIPLIVDGGPCQVGIESTVLDLSVTPAQVLRPGIISEEALATVVQVPSPQPQVHSPQSTVRRTVLRSPGLLEKHYAPRARLVILEWKDERDLRLQSSKFIAPNLKFSRQRGGGKLQPSKIHVISHTRIPSGEGLGSVSVIPHDAEAFARALYAELHRCDEASAELIIVEKPPPGREWAAVADRLKRASG